MSHPKNSFDIRRYDSTNDRSLKAYSAADEYLLEDFIKLSTKPSQLAVYHDRFGYLSCHLHAFQPTVILTNKSQQKAIQQNLEAHDLSLTSFSNPLQALDEKIEFALIKIPKSLDLFELFLDHISQNATDEVTVVVAFMTRHFSPKILEIANRYFENVVQSRAVKKARLVTLTEKKQTIKLELIDVLTYKDQSYKQYRGVFSAKHIDYATQYFLEHLVLKNTDRCVLDLAAGNGVIGKEISSQLPDAEIHLMDDFYLAVESAKLNIQGKHIHHHFNNDLSIFEENTFDLIVTNPPFHFEYEVNINIPIQLFEDCFRCLKTAGNLQIVANKHLNYRTHLKAIFPLVEVLAENEKFTVYKCVKSVGH